MCNYVKLSNLANERLNAGLTVEDAAHLIGITAKEWRAYEKEPLTITGAHMIDICYCLGMAASYLYGFTNTPYMANKGA